MSMQSPFLDSKQFEFDYLPRSPKEKSYGIGIIGCGAIVRNTHIPAYRAMGWKIMGVADPFEENAKKAGELAGGVPFYTDYAELLKRPDVDIIDAATHPSPRVKIIEDALEAGKHVLSQKPFVLDLEIGERLAKLAKNKKCILAVNQNGRWSPPWKIAHEMVKSGVVGEVIGVHFDAHWDHNWVVGRPFDQIKHCVLYDFAIHFFDILTCWMGDRKPKRVYATTARASNQKAQSAMLGQAMVEYDGAQASLVFDASCRVSRHADFRIEGTKGSIVGNERDSVALHLPEGVFTPKFKGSWFPDGFKGTMGELLCSVDEGRMPWTDPISNLRGLQLCFAACVSADEGKPIDPSRITKLPPGNVTA
jgi:predicted dehydrogenase